jgi:hypothetical protein
MDFPSANVGRLPGTPRYSPIVTGPSGMNLARRKAFAFAVRGVYGFFFLCLIFFFNLSYPKMTPTEIAMST